MKLYLIDNCNINQWLKKLVKKNIPCIETFTEKFYSKQGIYEIGNKDIQKLHIINETSKHFNENEMNWILDESILKKEKVYQMPFEHIKITLKQLSFSQNQYSKVKFIIEKNPMNENIIDFYFDIQWNDIPWQEIKEFLLVVK